MSIPRLSLVSMAECILCEKRCLLFQMRDGICPSCLDDPDVPTEDGRERGEYMHSELAGMLTLVGLILIAVTVICVGVYFLHLIVKVL